MAESLLRELADESATEALAAHLARSVGGGLVLYLAGDLGAGKTTFARSLLRQLGVTERVKSPTYSLVEPYTLADGRRAWHLDLYRIADPGELEWLGVEDLADPDALILVEWPERGAGSLPAADLLIRLDVSGRGRRAAVTAQSPRGERQLLAWKEAAAAS